MATKHFFCFAFFTILSYSMEDNSSDFIAAARQGDTPAMKHLITKNISQYTLVSALLSAIKTFNVTTCRFIINETSITGNEVIQGFSLISHATHAGNQMATSLLLNKPKFNFKQPVNGITLIEVLAQNGYATLLSDILKKNIFTSQECKNALMVATLNGQEEAVKELLQHGTSPIDYPLNKTPLHRAVAAEEMKSKIIKMLLDAGSVVDQEDNNGYTPLFITACRNKYSIAKLLVGKGASIEKAHNCASAIQDLTAKTRLEHWFKKTST